MGHLRLQHEQSNLGRYLVCRKDVRVSEALVHHSNPKMENKGSLPYLNWFPVAGEGELPAEKDVRSEAKKNKMSTVALIHTDTVQFPIAHAVTVRKHYIG